MATWEISRPYTLSKYKSLANTIKRHLHFLPNDDSYNIHLKSLIVISNGKTLKNVYNVARNSDGQKLLLF